MELTYLILRYGVIPIPDENETIETNYDKPEYVVVESGMKIVGAIATDDQEIIDKFLNHKWELTTKEVYDEAHALLQLSNSVLFKSKDTINGTPMTLDAIRAMEPTGHLKGYRILHIKHKVGNNVRLDTVLIDEDFTGSAEQPFNSGTNVLEIIGDR